MGFLTLATPMFRPLKAFFNFPKVMPKRRWAGHVARIGEERGVYRFMVGKPEERRPLR